MLYSTPRTVQSVVRPWQLKFLNRRNSGGMYNDHSISIIGTVSLSPRSVLPQIQEQAFKVMLFAKNPSNVLNKPAETNSTASSDTAQESEDEEIIYLTTPPPPTRWQKQRKRLTTPPPESHGRHKKWRRGPGIVDLTRPMTPPKERSASPPYKRVRMTNVSAQRTSRALEALDRLEAMADAEAAH